MPSSRARVRGCTGKTTGMSRRARSSASTVARSSSRVVDERGTMQRHERVVARLHAEPRATASRRGRRSRCASSESIIVLPTKWTRSPVDALAREVLDRALASATSRSALRWSVRRRLCSSGIVRSKLRSPASRCATGTSELHGGERAGERRVHVAGDDDEVGRCSTSTCSIPTSARAVCSACVPEPTPRKTSGCGQAELAEEDVRHLRVVVLAGVDERDLGLRLQERAMDGRRLHEVRPRADDEA